MGSDQAGQYIYERGSHNGKRVQSNMGAKNHGIVMPDANKEQTLNQLTAAAFGVELSFRAFISVAIVIEASSRRLDSGAWPCRRR